MSRVAFVLILCPLVWASDPPAADLASPSFQDRERASRDLWNRGESARPDLVRLAASPDAEVAGRARAVLARFDAADYPGVPEGLAKLARDFRSGTPEDRVRLTGQMLDHGPAGWAVLKPLVKNHVPATELARFEAGYLARVRRAVALRLFTGDTAGAEGLAELGLAASGYEGALDLAMLHASAGQPDRAVAPAGTRPSGRAVAAQVAGRPADALAAAREFERSGGGEPAARLLDALLEDQKAWPALGARPEFPANSLGGLRAFRLARAGNPERAEELFAALASDPALGGDPLRVDPSAIGLFLNGQTDRGVSRLDRLGLNPHIVSDVHVARLDLVKALESAADRPAAPEGDGFAPGTDPATRILAASRQGRLHALLGDPGKAKAEFEAGYELHAAADDTDWRAVYQLLRMQARTGPDGARLAARQLDAVARRRGAAGRTRDYEQPYLIEAVFADDADLATPVVRALAGVGSDDESPEFRKAATESTWRAFNGQLTNAELEFLDVFLAGKGQCSQALATIHLEHRRSADALRVLKRKWFDALPTMKLREPGPAAVGVGRLFGTDEQFTMWVDLADQLRLQGRPAESAKIALDAWKFDPNNPVLLIVAAQALRQLGDATEADRLTALSHRVSLGSVRHRGRYLRFLIARGFENTALMECELTRKVAWLPEPNAGNAWSQVLRVAAARGKPELALEACDRILLHILRTPYFGFIEGAGYVNVPHVAHGYRAQLALKNQDYEAAVAEARELFKQLPTNSTEFGAVVRGLAEADRAGDARALFEFGWERHERLLAAHPESAWVCREAATFACDCRHRLADALKLAARAAELDPDSADGQALLAECHFRTGDRPAALKVLDDLIAKNPRSQEYPRQRAFYRTGDPNATLPPAD